MTLLILREPPEHTDPSSGCCDRDGVHRSEGGAAPIPRDHAIHREHRQRGDYRQQQAASGAGDHRDIHCGDDMRFWLVACLWFLAVVPVLFAVASVIAGDGEAAQAMAIIGIGAALILLAMGV